MSKWTEADISINGTKLSVAESMTMRVALESFVSDILVNGIGEDEHGRRMTEAYTNCVLSIRELIYQKRLNIPEF